MEIISDTKRYEKTGNSERQQPAIDFSIIKEEKRRIKTVTWMFSMCCLFAVGRRISELCLFVLPIDLNALYESFAKLNDLSLE
jgi:hypothetical protein